MARADALDLAATAHTRPRTTRARAAPAAAPVVAPGIVAGDGLAQSW